MAAALLLLFDIDGTLVWRASAEHADALRVAIREVHGVDTHGVRARISPAGRTDGEIARLMLLDLGVSAAAIDEHADEVAERCVQAYADLCPADLSHTLVPGITDVLRWLDGRDDVRLSLVTGNFEGIARLKLKRAGIGHHFPPGQGAFGSDSEERAALPHIARKRAGHDGIAHPRERTIVIGDTPRDIACARADGVRCFAVATGAAAAQELTGADALAQDAAQLRGLLSDLL
ncbi:MAG TPA: haloacid dehalogenase-like hydrolase [Solirubrobacteraceae bacterium]|nr:haloacid dehalogenase-like hydrolase [Solirubrobacteraceae bacterium]